MNVVQTGPLGVNTWIVPLDTPGGNDVFVVDPAGCSATGDETEITDYLEKNSLNLVAVLLTHGHFDHVLGISAIKKKYPKIKIAIHKEDSTFIGKDSQKLQKICLEALNAEVLLPYLQDLPEADFILEDNVTLDKGFDEDYCIKMCAQDKKRGQDVYNSLKKWTVIHTPGHTKGSVCFFSSEQKILISGDTLFYRGFGRTDLYGGNYTELIKSLQKLKKVIPPDTLVYPGHDYSSFALTQTFSYLHNF